MDDADLKQLIEASAAETRRYFDTVGEGLRHQIQLVAEGVETNTAQIQRLDSRLEQLDSRVERLDVKVAQLDAKVEALDAKVEGLDEKVEQLDERVEQLDAKVDHLATDMKEEFAEVRQVVSVLQARVERIDSPLH
jgi:chromosome segregation ATPase